ncbi:MAG: hypothetical protein ACRDNF_04660 [Streptosporangiaceae bacterium]
MAAPAAGAAWHSEPTVNPIGDYNGSLAAVSCTSASACTAVGTYDDRASVAVTLAERWNGSTWNAQATPNPAGARSSQLASVSCTSAVSCAAAGYDTGAAGVIVPLVEVWNGTRWAIQSTPVPPGRTGTLFGISCTAVSACTAVGDDGLLPLAERWNGATWAIQPTPVPSRAAASGLFTVSCPAVGACTAVGSSYSTRTGTDTTLAEGWNGSTWAIQPTPAPSGAIGGQFGGVSCTAAGACTATGYYDSSTATETALAERWNGATWAIQPTPVRSGAFGGELGAVSCASASACTAAGAYENSAGEGRLLAETWNGSTWTVQATPNPPRGNGRYSTEFTAVSCLPAGSCMAAGDYPGPINAARPLAESWTGGAWVLHLSVGRTGAKHSYLNAVSCPAVASCTAVGGIDLSIGTSTGLAETWNGARWRIQATPAPAGAAGWSLSSVSCPSARACTAVGYYVRNLAKGRTYPLAETWNGSAWHLRATPNPSGGMRDASLNSVSCTAPDACTALSAYAGKSGTHGIVERWDGTRWSIQYLATPAAAKAVVTSGVSCTSDTACVVVGYYETATSDYPLAEMWNGTSWHILQVPLPAKAQRSGLDAVACTAANACTVTGYYNFPARSLVERWNGTAWTIQPTPNPPHLVHRDGVGFGTVACASAHACVAFGNYDLHYRLRAYTEGWNGTAWHVRAIDLPGSGSNLSFVNAVTCVATHCTAVGLWKGSGNVSVTLALVGLA